MAILVTGAAGFIGYHISQALLNRGEQVVGIDELNTYYDLNLKEARLSQLKASANFSFHQISLEDQTALFNVVSNSTEITEIIHLAAQAGVRYSLEAPEAYISSNLVGHSVMLELCRQLPNLRQFIYASSSSVYGANTKLPFSVKDDVNKPISLYAATKRSGELLSYSYSHLFNIPMTGLRFFTVYGPWGRPDMAAFIFTKALLTNTEISVFNNGDMIRNFTYIDDIIDGILGCLHTPPKQPSENEPAYRLLNLGNSQTVRLMDFISTLEKLLNKKANIKYLPLQPGDVKATIADISDTTSEIGFEPKTNIEEGLKSFVDWYLSFYHKQ